MPAASSIYWNSEGSQRSSGDGSELPSTSSSSGPLGGRRYVDPWDLENYAYLRRQQNFVGQPRLNDDGMLHPYNLPSQNNESSSDSYYWYPMPVMREPTGYSPANTIENLYLAPSRQMHNQANIYPVQQPFYDDEARYVTPNPVYVPLSDLEYSEEAVEHPAGLKVLPRKRNRPIKNMAYHKEECPCPYHGPLLDAAVSKETRITPTKQLGLNTYGHLRIDYTKSWNSLHRKMKK